MSRLAEKNITTLNVTIEIPKHSQIKYEYDRKTKAILVDRVLYGAMHYPQNYGFIPEALDWDGDELDILVIADQPLLPGVHVKTRLLGAMAMIDGGETDTKLIGVIDSDPRYANMRSFADVPQAIKNEIKDFFENYKNLQKKKVEVKDFQDLAWASAEYAECVELMKKYGKMDKDDFIAKMKKEHPEKYTLA